MWAGGDDLHEDDSTPVRIYQPILYGGSRKPNLDDATGTCVGGPPSPSLCCRSCGDELYPLVQLYTSQLNRTLQVWACNRLACFRSLFGSDGSGGRKVLCYGGGNGVVVCRRLPAIHKETRNALLPVMTPPQSSATAVNEWAMGMHDQNDTATVDNDQDMDELESKLAAMETKKGDIATKPLKETSAYEAVAKPSLPLGFPMFELHSLPEPLAPRSGLDDDDVGMASTGRGADDRKIQQMLAQYMAMEDDEEILAALRGTGTGAHIAGRSGGERDERLSASDRALWTFTDRIKRSPRQVVRYARGGVPLWSM
jgi:pre-rRNA-processing protein TSR4